MEKQLPHRQHDLTRSTTQRKSQLQTPSAYAHTDNQSQITELLCCACHVTEMSQLPLYTAGARYRQTGVPLPRAPQTENKKHGSGLLNLTTPGQSQTLPDLTSACDGEIVYLYGKSKKLLQLQGLWTQTRSQTQTQKQPWAPATVCNLPSGQYSDL